MRRFRRYAAAVAAFGFGYVAVLYLTLPDVRVLRTQNVSSTAFMDLRAREARAEGREARRVHHWMPYARISPHLRRAVLVAEDAGFWGHEGIDLVEIQKSLETDWERGTLTRGASTITQQLAKNLYLSPSRNPFRKLCELWIARRLENELSKTRIFELYLNDIEWGDGIWGAEAAARTYFGISAASVGPDQAALMAGAIVNPRMLNIASFAPVWATSRRHQSLRCLLRLSPWLPMRLMEFLRLRCHKNHPSMSPSSQRRRLIPHLAHPPHPPNLKTGPPPSRFQASRSRSNATQKLS
jgi:monofunctional biosynthetic peptidoglycan transglycosylase